MNDEITESVIGFDALFESMLKCKKGVIWKGSTASFYLNGIEKCLKLEKELKDGTYKSGKPVTFTITHPKKREIVSIRFRDRVYQRSLNDNYIYPEVAKQLIPENAACQKGKGTDYARKMLLEYMREMQKEYGSYYVLQCDIKGYYPNMRHDVAADIFRKMLPSEEIYRMSEKVLREQYAGDTGYNPGSQMIQIVGIAALDDEDHFIRDELGIGHYVRYMDDFLLLHHDKAYLEECLSKITEKMAVKGFQLNEKKTRIYEASKGITFLGFIFKPRHSGKIVVTRTPERVKAERRKLKRLVRKAAEGGISRAKVFEHYQIWRSTVVWDGSRKSRKKNSMRNGFRSDNHRMAMRMDAYFKTLRQEHWREDNDQQRDQKAQSHVQKKERK